jgi:hypothetical protein
MVKRHHSSSICADNDTETSMSLGKLSALIVASTLGAAHADAAEIKNECPQINDTGGRIKARMLMPASLLPIETRQVAIEGENNPNFFDLHTTYWRPGMAPITDATFHCIYDNKESLDIAIIGMLLRCERPDSKHFQRKEELPMACISETDPGLLQNK